jgi:hypothetical protein
VSVGGGPRGAADDDVRLRRYLVRMGGISAAAAVAVPLVGLLGAARGPERSVAPAEAAPSSSPGTVRSPTSPPQRVLLSEGGTPSSPVVWRVRPGADQSKNAVFAAYKIYVGTSVRLAEQPDPDDVALAQIALDPQLGRLRRALAASATAGHSLRGRVVAVARVEAVHGGKAVVVGCLDAGAQRLYGPDDRAVPRQRVRGSPSRLSVSRAWMRRDGGRWKVYALAALPASRCHR